MKLGNKKIFCFIFFLFFFNGQVSFTEEKILSSPLINLNDLKPSFEEVDESSKEAIGLDKIQNKSKIAPKNNFASAKFIGLDKITAKTSEINVNLGEIKKFGPLEIKVLKCGKFKADNKIDNVAYLQVKDSKDVDNEKIFIFNGWTFSSDPTLAPFDHAIYDLQLVNCNNT
tara:strand:+ start:131 stop:643 length:513 start_codon:yes stop_codon:yes gene_type:complete